MHSPDILKLLQQVLAPPPPPSHLTPEGENTSPKRAATVLDSDDEMGLGDQQVLPDEDLLKKLRFFFPDALVLAAFDIVDRDGGGRLVIQGEGRTADVNAIVVRYASPLQRIQYQVAGTKRDCYVFPNLPVWSGSGVNRCFCDCPTFTLSVLSAESNFMASAFFHLGLQELTRCGDSASTSWPHTLQRN